MKTEKNRDGFIDEFDFRFLYFPSHIAQTHVSVLAHSSASKNHEHSQIE